MLTEVTGLVIRSVDLTENDKLLTILTHEHGKITAVANGSKSLKSRYMSAAELFCYSKYMLYQKADKYWLRDVDLKESFFDLRCDIVRTALAEYICDIACEVGTENLPDEDFLRLVLNSLYAASKGNYSLKHIKAAFEFRAASIIGFMPELDGCRICEKKRGEFILDVMNGNMICAECNSEDSKPYEAFSQSYNQADRRVVCLMSNGTTLAARYIINCPLKRLFAFSISKDDLDLLAHASETYLLNHIERGFKSLDFFNQVAD